LVSFFIEIGPVASEIQMHNNFQLIQKEEENNIIYFYVCYNIYSYRLLNQFLRTTFEYNIPIK